MSKAALVIMAAGIGSRFGGGIKQLASIGPNKEIITDYSVYDAVKAGFDKVVFVIRKDIEKEFRETIGKRVEKIVKTEYVFQELDDIPEEFYEKCSKRVKPWGTGQAILCCKDVIEEPFLIINSDDYYGRNAYKIAFEELCSGHPDTAKTKISMIGFVLENTLSDNGAVTRGVCRIDDRQMLKKIKETYELEKVDGKAHGLQDGKKVELPLDSVVSMNMWCVYPEFIDILDKGFYEFLEQLPEQEMKREYLLPTIIGDLVSKDEAEVKVLKSEDQWFGVPYQEDVNAVVSSIRKLIEEGVYPENLYTQPAL